MTTGNRNDCEQIKSSETDIKFKISGLMGDINNLDAQKTKLEQEFEREKQRVPIANKMAHTVAVLKDTQSAELRHVLLNTRN